MHVKNTICKVSGKDGRIYALRNEVTWIEVESKCRVIVNRIERGLGGVLVKGDFGGMNL